MIHFADLDHGGDTASATVVHPDGEINVEWTVYGGEARITGEALLAATVVAAGRTNQGVSIDVPVSEVFAAQMVRLQDIHQAWFGWRRHPLRLNGGTTTRRGARRPLTVAFFSGGVDSFYSALAHRPALDALVHVRGLDLPFAEAGSDTLAAALRSVRLAADQLGLPLIETSTTVKEVSDRLDVPWAELYHGPALFSLALTMQGTIGRALVPSSSGYRDLHPWGAHALTDPLYSTEALRLEHDGAAATRTEKVAAIARSPAAMAHLRVCYKSGGGGLNCGRCEKCLRTMAMLRIVGVLDRCETLPHELDLDALARTRVTRRSVEAFYEGALAALAQRQEPDAELEAVIRQVLDQAQVTTHPAITPR